MKILKILKKWYVTLGIVIILAIVGFVIYGNLQKSKLAAQMSSDVATVEKGDLTAVVGATGSVAANQTVSLVWQTTGIVEKVNVKLGSKVKKDDILAQLSKSSLPQTVILAESDLVSAQKALDDLKRSQTASAQAQQALATAEEELDAAKKHLESLDYPRGTPERISIAQNDYDLAQELYERAEEEFEGLKWQTFDNPERVIAYNNLQNARAQRDAKLKELQWFTGKPDNFEREKRKAELAVAQAKYDDAKREWERLKDGPTKEDIAAAQAKVDAIKATLNYSKVIAPFNATVTNVGVKVGDMVSTGSGAFRLDDLTHLLVNVDVSEVDINRIEVGQAATLTFDAILGKEYEGKVTEVANVGTVSQGVVNFAVTIEITNPDESVKPGMTSAVNIVVNEVKNVLLIPNRAVRLLGGDRVVYVMKNGMPTPVKIKLGASSDTMSELVSGEIKEGDQILLNPPTTSMFGPGGAFGD